MSKPSLAERRAAAGPVPLPKATKTVTLVEGQHLLDESERLQNELVDLLAEAERDEESEEARESKDRTRKAGAKPESSRADLEARVDAIREAQAALWERLAEHQAEVGLVGLTGGDWHRFKEDHPPRPDSEMDKRLTGGWCSATAVFDRLGDFVKSLDGEDLAGEDWSSWLAETITYADRRELVSAVVGLHESRLNRVPFSSTASSTTGTSATD